MLASQAETEGHAQDDEEGFLLDFDTDVDLFLKN